MSAVCAKLHRYISQFTAFSFPFESEDVPENGLYILFEKGESAHTGKRIVRVGTHTGERQLRPRLHQHFVQENKDRSIFRKNLGRALLRQSHDTFLDDWNLDLTTVESRRLHGTRVDSAKMQKVERQVTAYMRSHFEFVVFTIADKRLRLHWESRLIATVSLCETCFPSADWLGSYSPLKKIRESGLWQVNELYKQPLSEAELSEFIDVVGTGGLNY